MNFQRAIRVSGLLLTLFSLSIVSGAQRGRDDDRRRGDEGRWEVLGTSHVDGRNDHDKIVVNRSESFRALQLEVRGGAIDFQRVVVHFDNGADHRLDIRDRIRDGGRSRQIDLPGDRRRIRSVEFWYSKENWRSRPSVNLWGLSGFGGDSGYPGRRDEGRRFDEDRWEVIGQSHVDGRNDHDRIVVNSRESFRALQLGIRGGAIEFSRVLVHFENGEDTDLSIRDRIEDRGKTRVIDLPGNRRRIRSIEFWYSKERWRSRPYVNVWGLR